MRAQAVRATDKPDPGMRIDALAQHVGTTSRTIREHQTRGLLHPPRLVGRVGYYDATHVARLQVIATLQERGFSLAAIKELLDAWSEGADVEQLLGFGRDMLARFSDERPEVLTRAQVFERVPGVSDERMLRLAVRAGVVTPHPEGGYVLRSRRLVEIGTELTGTGVPLEVALETAALLRRRLHTVAEQMVRLFEAHVWTPFATAGMPAGQWPAVNDALQRLRPRATEALQIIFAQEMEAEVTAVGFENARRMGRSGGSRSRSAGRRDLQGTDTRRARARGGLWQTARS